MFVPFGVDLLALGKTRFHSAQIDEGVSTVGLLHDAQ